ncbi:uncharacterized protein KQ657_002828 [Scheffersomyces spartinae]|uniref:Uncharacterized protein n=1 Tax=Scheffersomyces spartinae TaxID=45513 RepID=A0A9P7V5D7_9ASCO|nr:uncharacterized protein KQ657_002828 [Scheffersomyces spartinae]KAG7191692.1 hypothetical protein KQ657_002828 [Scheffersomyces spartinae]
MIYRSRPLNNGNRDNDIDNDNDQHRKANLGSTLDTLKDLVPDILQRSLPKELLANDVVLRVLPTHFSEVNSYLPPLKGHVSYYATAKAIQLYINSLVGNPHVKVHILSVRTTNSSDVQCLFPHSNKIIMRWITCNSQCDHLDPDPTASRRRSFSTTRSYKFNPSNVADFILENSNTPPKKLNLQSISSTLANVTQGLLNGLSAPGSSDKVETVLSGIFVFELNNDNTQVLVHTIEDVDVIERYDEIQDPIGGPLAC